MVKAKNEKSNVQEDNEKQEDSFLDKIYEESFKELEEGNIVKGKVIHISDNEVMIDIGYKSEVILPKAEFKDPSSIQEGDEVDVLLENKETEEGTVQASKSKADLLKNWKEIINNYNEGDVIEGAVAHKVKGGLMVDIGMEAFLPASLAAVRSPKELSNIVGKKYKFKILKINQLRKNIVVSRKHYLDMQLAEDREKLLLELEKGQVRKGVVKNITDFGAFIDLGGVDGLLHITDISWGRISHPSEKLAIGDEIEVMVLNFDKKEMKVSLGLKQKTADPWENIEEKYPAGSKTKGKVVNIVPYGAFVELEKGIEGLIHISEFSWTRRIKDPQEVLAIGDVVEIAVLDIDKESKKISLGLKQTETNPWEEIAQKYPEGSTIKGKVHHLTSYGAFVQLEDGVDGLIHISDMSWTKKINNPEEIVKKGEKVEAKILSVDVDNQKISLGLKQLKSDPWPKIKEKYAPGLIVDGTVSKVANFGVFVELEKNLEGLIHISELEKKPEEDLSEKYKIGDPIKIRVINIDDEERKIALTAKAIS
jgi:small subunit ribosomal protein S1